jgi:NAD(P)-dependent dehydrogenase (short-subunit alcohol dehydrogenase family)
MTENSNNKTALVTGGSKGLGRALVYALLDEGWSVVTDARNAAALSGLAPLPRLQTLAGDVTDPAHRAELVATAQRMGGGLDLLVNNAGDLGPSPLPALRDYDIDALRRALEANVLAPLGLAQLALPHLARGEGAVLNITSDAAVEAYPGWGGYGASKAALEQLSKVLAAEEPEVAVWWVDPGDMRTDMHQAAFPDEDISDRPTPEAVVPALLALLQRRPPSGRYRAADLLSRAPA